MGDLSDTFILTAAIKRRTLDAGFDLVGACRPDASRHAAYLREWIAAGQHGSMEYLARRIDERADPGVYLPGARGVLCAAMNYHVPLEATAEVDPSRGDNVAPASDRRPLGKIARYALGDDYHDRLRDRLRAIANWIEQSFPGHRAIACVDTSPLPEKELAARAGIGWMGKNTCIINPQIGSWLLLGEVITTLPLTADDPAVDRCGTCARCIDACPTGAITGPYQLDARRCISYLTIEDRSAEIDPAFATDVGDWLYGCDICQDVCPWNRRAPGTTLEEFQPRFTSGTLDAMEVLGWTPDEYRAALRGSAMKRAKLPMLQRNAKLVVKNAAAKTLSSADAP